MPQTAAVASATLRPPPAFQALDGTVLGQVLAQEIKSSLRRSCPGRTAAPAHHQRPGVLQHRRAQPLNWSLEACCGLGSMDRQLRPGRLPGKRCTLYSIVGAIIVGAAAALINFAVDLGQAADPGDLTP